jgi:hypothetical protein
MEWWMGLPWLAPALAATSLALQQMQLAASSLQTTTTTV